MNSLPRLLMDHEVFACAIVAVNNLSRSVYRLESACCFAVLPAWLTHKRRLK